MKNMHAQSFAFLPIIGANEGEPGGNGRQTACSEYELYALIVWFQEF
jgi:hypothetical protein